MQSLTVWKERIDFNSKSLKKANSKDWKYVMQRHGTPRVIQTRRAGSDPRFLLFILFSIHTRCGRWGGSKRLCRQRLTHPSPPLRWCLSCIYTGVCVYFSTSRVQLSSQLVDVWSAFSSCCLQNIRGWKLSFLSGPLPSLFGCCPMLIPLCRQLIQEIYTYK